MPWPTWDQAAIAAVLAWGVAFVLRRWRAETSGAATAVAAPALNEFALVAALYSLWRIARKLPLAHDEGAIERAYQIVDFQTWLRFPAERSLLEFVAGIDWLARVASTYYAVLHVPGLIAFLVWLWWRHRDHYPHWRNGLALLTAGCLVIRFVRVAPPRFLTDLGYYDLSALHGFDLYGPVGTGVSDQFAAMPSIHVGWAAVVSFGIVAASTSRWRWLFLSHVIITFLVVAATGNHWWLDGIVAIALLAGGLALDSFVRRRWPRTVPAPAPDLSRTVGDSTHQVVEFPHG